MKYYYKQGFAPVILIVAGVIVLFAISVVVFMHFYRSARTESSVDVQPPKVKVAVGG